MKVDKIVIVGCGIIGKLAKASLKEEGINIYAFFDSKHFDLPEQRTGVLVAPRSGAQFFAVALKGIQ